MCDGCIVSYLVLRNVIYDHYIVASHSTAAGSYKCLLMCVGSPVFSGHQSTAHRPVLMHLALQNTALPVEFILEEHYIFTIIVVPHGIRVQKYSSMQYQLYAVYHIGALVQEDTLGSQEGHIVAHIYFCSYPSSSGAGLHFIARKGEGCRVVACRLLKSRVEF